MPLLIIQLIFIASLLGLLLMVVRKLPALVELPESLPSASPTKSFQHLYRQLWPRIFNFSHILLQKLLSRLRILALKTEVWLEQHLRALRQSHANNKKPQDLEYWDKLKKK